MFLRVDNQVYKLCAHFEGLFLREYKKLAPTLTTVTSSSAFSSSALSPRDACAGTRTDGEPFPLQSLHSVGPKCLGDGDLEFCMLAEWPG